MPAGGDAGESDGLIERMMGEQLASLGLDMMASMPDDMIEAMAREMPADLRARAAEQYARHAAIFQRVVLEAG